MMDLRLPASLLLLGAAACSSPSVRPVAGGARPLDPAAPVEEATASAKPGPRASDTVPPGAQPKTVQAELPVVGSGAGSSRAGSAGGSPSAGSGPVNQVAWPRGVDGQAEVTVASVAGRPISLSDFVSKWILRDPDGVRAILDDLVLSRIVLLESASMGLEPPVDEVEASVRTQLASLERDALAAGAPDLESYVEARLGFDPAVFLRHLQEEAAVDRMAPRCVRAWLLSTDRRDVRAITVQDQAGIDQVRARLAAGEPFADVARSLSTDPSREDGGRIPALVRSDLSLAQTAFATTVGQVAGPVAEGDGFVFVYVEAAPERITGDWSKIGPLVEQSLKDRDVEDPEFWQWKDAMAQRYDVDTKPFLDLATR